jgi:hypothetical protein
VPQARDRADQHVIRMPGGQRHGGRPLQLLKKWRGRRGPRWRL